MRELLHAFSVRTHAPRHLYDFLLPLMSDEILGCSVRAACPSIGSHKLDYDRNLAKERMNSIAIANMTAFLVQDKHDKAGFSAKPRCCQRRHPDGSPRQREPHDFLSRRLQR